MSDVLDLRRAEHVDICFEPMFIFGSGYNLKESFYISIVEYHALS